MYLIFFIPSFVDGHLGCFHVVTIVNSAAWHWGTCVFLSYDSLGVLGLLGHTVVSSHFLNKSPTALPHSCISKRELFIYSQ